MVPIPSATGTDFKRTVNGRDWRVRVRVCQEIATSAPMNGNPEVEPSGVGVSVSVALLNSEGEVDTSSTGKLLIFSAHVLTLQREAQARPDFNPQAEIETVIASQITEAEKELEGKTKLNAALAPWLATGAMVGP
jgi:hypothetical protein